MVDAIYYDGTTARRRNVSLALEETSLAILEAGEQIASWRFADLRQRDGTPGTLRLSPAGATLERIEIADEADQEAIRARCPDLDAQDRDRTGMIVLWSFA